MQLRDAQESHSIFDLPSYLLWLNFVSKCVRSTPDSPCSYTHPPTSSFRTVYPPRSSLNATSYASDMCYGRKSNSPNRPSGITTAAQSMDLGFKVDTKLEVRPLHSFDQSRDSGEDSPSHLSLHGSLHPNRASSSTTDSPLGVSLQQIGFPWTTYRFLAPVTTTTAPSSITWHTRSQTLPSGNSTGAAFPPHNARAHSHSTIGPSRRRALAPRLATLPPPLMAQYRGWRKRTSHSLMDHSTAPRCRY